MDFIWTNDVNVNHKVDGSELKTQYLISKGKLLFSVEKKSLKKLKIKLIFEDKKVKPFTEKVHSVYLNWINFEGSKILKLSKCLSWWRVTGVITC